MDILTGLALFSGGAVAGGLLMAEFYGSLKRVQEHERKKAEARMEAANRQMDAMGALLQMSTTALRDMEKRRDTEASWCDGYEAGMREAMQNAMNGVTIGDVVTMTRLRNARRVRSANE